MLDRVAAAIRESEAYWWNRDDEPEDGLAETLARVAIAAMREPTGEMKDAGADSFEYGSDDGVSLAGQPTKCWQAMIDAAFPRQEKQDAPK